MEGDGRVTGREEKGARVVRRSCVLYQGDYLVDL